jgi:tetratricopeptide (TPR) repeat protein
MFYSLKECAAFGLMLRTITAKCSVLSSLLFSCFILSGCLSTFTGNEPTNKRTTLADLAENSAELTLDEFEMDKTARERKLAEIYQQLLTIEPDPDVRANVKYRLVQINTDVFEEQSFGGSDEENSSVEDESLTLDEFAKNDESLKHLVNEYQTLLTRYPDRAENENIRYQLAKALDLRGEIDASLATIESLLSLYPETRFLAELNFRRGEIYYNRQNYSAALSAYNQVLASPDNDRYRVNSLYMSGWVLFKLNRLPEADVTFIKVFEEIVAAEKQRPYEEDFAFEKLGSRYQNLLIDTQRVLSISLSQQQQSESLVNLVTQQQSQPYIYLYQHVLFRNLADFLIKKDLNHDAELTYQAYIGLETNNVWAARFSLALLDLYQRQGKFSSMRQLKNKYVGLYGLNGSFWASAKLTVQEELLPYLLQFTEEESRRLYAAAQDKEQGSERINAFSQTANALENYLALANLTQAKAFIDKDILSDEYLYADANFEAKQYRNALESYEKIAYYSVKSSSDQNPIKLQSAYATTITIREMIKSNSEENSTTYQQLMSKRNALDKRFIEQYPNDFRSLELATHASQYSFENQDYVGLKYFSDFVLNTHQVNQSKMNSLGVNKVGDLSSKSLKQIQIVTQLLANDSYNQEHYALAEDAYVLALKYAEKSSRIWSDMRDLLASSIYFQAQMVKAKQPQLAIQHLLRVGQVVPESTYRVTAEFDAANLLLDLQLWREAIDVLLPFQQRYPTHEYSASIPAKLAKSYEEIGQWELAAEQLVILTINEKSVDVKREAQYTAAEYYAKAGNTTKALDAYRTYAHSYPEPFDIAQEVRFKMSEFYRESKEPTKQYYWLRKILSFHAAQKKDSPQVIQARAIELAATAAYGLGTAHQQTFKRIKLKIPLPQSLKRKQKSMKQAIAYYQQVLDLQLADYVPKATFNLAEMYRQLAADVMTSQRPGDLDELALEEYEILLEELAYPFEEKAIDIHISNSQRAWQNIYDEWIDKSFKRLAELAPALYHKQERIHEVINAIH